MILFDFLIGFDLFVEERVEEGFEHDLNDVFNYDFSDCVNTLI